jgi:hypothetical protein
LSNFAHPLACPEQLSKQTHGFGFPEQPIICDGTPHPNTFTVQADTSGPPFRKGDAAVEVFVRVGNETSCCISGSSGIQIIRLR